MLIFRFYNNRQKYIAETVPFPNGKINSKIQQARGIAILRKDICGWAVYEFVGGEWIPYHPFNRFTRYNINRKNVATI